MTTENDDKKPAQDWNKIASEALDLWQNHLTALANDPKAQEEMARFVAPMGQMFAQWTTMMQSGVARDDDSAQEAANEPKSENDEAPKPTKNPLKTFQQLSQAMSRRA